MDGEFPTAEVRSVHSVVAATAAEPSGIVTAE